MLVQFTHVLHDDVIKWKKNLRYWPFVRGTTGPVMRSFDVFFLLCLNKRLSKQSRHQWFDTPSCSLWCHCNVVVNGPNVFALSQQKWNVRYLNNKEVIHEPIINSFYIYYIAISYDMFTNLNRLQNMLKSFYFVFLFLCILLSTYV